MISFFTIHSEPRINYANEMTQNGGRPCQEDQLYDWRVGALGQVISAQPLTSGEGTLGSSLRSPAEVGGNEGFLLQPEKDLESPSSTRLEALVPSHDSRTMTRSISPRAWRHDFPGTAREAP